MTTAHYTYDVGLATARDLVRYYVGDRTDPWLLANEEIEAQLTLNDDSAIATAISMCSGLIAMFVRKASNPSVGPFSIDYGRTADQYRILLDNLKDEQRRGNRATPYLSGAELDQQQDGDMEPYLFDKEMHDNWYIETYEGVRSPTGYFQP